MLIAAGIVSLSLASGLAMPVASGPPHFNIERTCLHAGEPATGVGRPNQACRDDEQKAEITLQQNWASYPSASRNTCVEGASLGGPPSYVQVLTCIEMDAAK